MSAGAERLQLRTASRLSVVALKSVQAAAARAVVGGVRRAHGEEVRGRGC